MADPDAGLDVVDLVSRALRASHELAGALVVPTVLMDRGQLGEGDQPRRGADLANFVAGWFQRCGFYAERSNVGGHGYGEIIKEMRDWYPDTSETLRSRREQELARRDRLLAEFSKPFIDPSIQEFQRKLFEEQLVLREVMTEEQCDACYDVIFAAYEDDDGTWIDDFREVAGAPDLLVWHSDPLRKLWFFCEVKSQNDHLSQAQHAWLQQSWRRIEGRFLLLLLGS
jgi:hypothetical protein